MKAKARKGYTLTDIYRIFSYPIVMFLGSFGIMLGSIISFGAYKLIKKFLFRNLYKSLQIHQDNIHLTETPAPIFWLKSSSIPKQKLFHLLLIGLSIILCFFLLILGIIVWNIEYTIIFYFINLFIENQNNRVSIIAYTILIAQTLLTPSISLILLFNSRSEFRTILENEGIFGKNNNSTIA